MRRLCLELLARLPEEDSSPLSQSEVARACLERVQKLADRDGKHDVPTDLFAFSRQADVILLDGQNNPVDFDSVDITFMKKGQPVSFNRAIVAWERR